MTASASVVEALRRITEIYVGAPVNTEEANAYAGALQEAQDLANEALSALTPHHAEQDAREAVAITRLREIFRLIWEGDTHPVWTGHPEPQPSHDEEGPLALLASEGADLLAALAQAAPDGWRLVPVEPTEAMIEAGRVVGSLRFANRASDTYRAMLSASPAPPAQGAKP